MVIITRIGRLRDYGVFRDFRWPSDLPEFGRYNLIYGWNGTGKTMLSRLFQAVEEKEEPFTGQVTMLVSGRDVKNEEFPEVSVAVRVFNRDFVEKTVFPAGGDVAPIYFVLGKQNVEKQRQVEQLKASLEKAQAGLDSAREKKRHADSEFDKFCKRRALAIKEILRSPGTNPYNNYDKSDFEQRARKMASADDRQAHELSPESRETLLAQHRATPKPKIPPCAYRLPDLKSLGETVSGLLSTTVLSSVIPWLKEDAEASSWVHEGLGLHQERQATNCLFCGSIVPKDRLAALEAHFSTEYEEFLRKLDAQVTKVRGALKSISELSLPNPAQLYDDLISEYEAAQAKLEGELELAEDTLGALLKALEKKRGAVFERARLDIPMSQFDAGTVDRLNEVIQKHNKACDDFQSRAVNAREQLEAGTVADDLEEFRNLADDTEKAAPTVNEARAHIDRLKDEVRRLEKEIVEHRQPAEELNRDLHSYLGHDELRLEIKETGYAIVRRDAPAEALSEGETTAIALLYFLKSLQDRRFDLRKGVVVLDDPVSSLDANALYSAFGFIRERTRHAGQLVILTHNFTFFRQVRYWFHHLKGQKKKEVTQRPARFYMLDCSYKEGRRFASVRRLDPLLEQFESEYHYLFARISRAAMAEPQVALEQNYVLPNLARRLLETFLAFRRPGTPEGLYEKLLTVDFDKAKKTRILRFVHTYSHADALAEPEHDLSVLSEAHGVLNDLLLLMEKEDPDHYSAMASLVGSYNEREGS